MDFSIANRFSENDRFPIAISQVDILAGGDADAVKVDADVYTNYRFIIRVQRTFIEKHQIV